MSMSGSQAYALQAAAGFPASSSNLFFVGVAVAIIFFWGIGYLELLSRLDHRKPETLIFLPVRLNNQPVIMGGLTADEIWATLGISIAAELVLGIPAAILTH